MLDEPRHYLQLLISISTLDFLLFFQFNQKAGLRLCETPLSEVR